MHDVEHTTPPLPEVAATQESPPKEAVHGLFDEQVVILETLPGPAWPEMLIMVFELIMMIAPAVL